MPTVKQLTATQKLVENGGNVSAAMRAAGYSPATAKTPSKLTGSEGYKSITEELCAELGMVNVTPKKIARIIKQGLGAKQPGKIITIEKSTKGTNVSKKTVEYPDHPTRHRFLDTTLKIMGAYPSGDKSPTALILLKFKEMSGRYMEPTEPIEGQVAHAD